MPSSNRPLLSSFSTSRSSSVPSRPFIIILTNNPDMLRQTATFRLQIERPVQTTVTVPNDSSHHGTVHNGSNNNTNDREQILSNLLRVELRAVTRDYLTRSRRSFPIHYIFDMSDIESQQQP